MKSLSLPFDQYQRYRIVEEAVEVLRDGKKPLHVLDAGGNPGQVFLFLPEDRCVVLDREVNPGLKNYVMGDALSLPFPDSTFDMAVSVDTLEHIPPGGRKDFIAELWRVSKSHVLIATPARDPRVELAERVLFDITRDKLGFTHDFLKEHIEYGLPARDEVASWIKDLGGAAAFVPNGYLSHWLPMMALSFYVNSDPVLIKFAESINSFYNENFYKGDNREPCYRYLAVAGKNGLNEKALKGLEGLKTAGGEGTDLDLSWVSLLVTLKGYSELRAEKKALMEAVERKDGHIEELKKAVLQRDGQIEGLKKNSENLKNIVSGRDARIEELQKKISSIERQAAFRALRKLGIIEK